MGERVSVVESEVVASLVKLWLSGLSGLSKLLLLLVVSLSMLEHEEEVVAVDLAAVVELMVERGIPP